MSDSTDNLVRGAVLRSTGTPWGGHVVCFGLLAVVFAVGLIAGGGSVPTPKPLEAGEADDRPDVTWRIDPNTADWAELATLPRIGEVLAKRIVAYREAREAESGVPVAVFNRLEDLDEIKGIGPKTLERLADHVVFPGGGVDRGR